MGPMDSALLYDQNRTVLHFQQVHTGLNMIILCIPCVLSQCSLFVVQTWSSHLMVDIVDVILSLSSKLRNT